MSDKDSLFGSPPPSPSVRGRSPSLALPELPASPPGGQASSQNVGTIALPGSHEQCSELPVFIDAALPSEKPPLLSLRPPATSAPRRPPRTRRVAGSVSRPTRSPSRHPSPLPHNPQTDRTLRDLVGLISHFEPGAHNATQRPPTVAVPVASTKARDPNAEQHPPGTAQNPIDLDGPLSVDVPEPPVSQGPADAVNSALVALAGTVASALKLPTTPKDVPSISTPTVNNVLHIIKHDPKLIPVLQATYEYLGSVPNHLPQPPRSFSHVTTNNPNPSSKRRRSAVEKGSQVPAGAGHWNVPFPFAPGQGPKDYPHQWQLERGRRVLGDLLGLFERAFAQARGGNAAPLAQNGRPKKRRRTSCPGSSVQSARSDFDGSANGTSEQKYMPSESNDLDHKRMNEWLSSVPASSSIVESTGIMPSPAPSEPAPLNDNLQDLMAMLGPSPVTSSAKSGDDKDPTFDFDTTFYDAELPQDDMQWQSLFGYGPMSQSINDITAFPMGFQEASASQPSATQANPQSPHLQSLECVIDPVLMALSRQQQSAPGSSSSSLSLLGGMQSGITSSVDLNFLSAESDALASFLEPTSQFHKEPENTKDNSHFSGVCDSSEINPSDAHSGHTVPTMSASSSQAQSRYGSVAPTDLHTPSVVSSASSSASSKAQHKVDLLAKAQEHRARLLREIEKAKTERWETIIEGGVLRNLQKVDVS